MARLSFGSMKAQETGKRQHIVPQQMIRRFAGEDGKLVEMVKPEFQVGTRRRSPSGILFRDDFYKYGGGDLDAELLIPLEQNFAKIYDEVLEMKALDTHQESALIAWVASMLVRTQFVNDMPLSWPQYLPRGLINGLTNMKNVVDNHTRVHWYATYSDLFARKDWNWKFYWLSDNDPKIVITDHPVCTTGRLNKNEFMVIVPLAQNVALFGGHEKALEQVAKLSIGHLNFFLASWARERIFAGCKETLELVRWLLSDNSPFDSDLVARARQPFGRIPEHSRISPPNHETANDVNPGKALQAFRDSYGSSR